MANKMLKPIEGIDVVVLLITLFLTVLILYSMSKQPEYTKDLIGVQSVTLAGYFGFKRSSPQE